MVEKMPSSASNDSSMSSEAPELPALPSFDRPMMEPWPLRMSWSEAIRAFAPFRAYYMEHFDSPERRFRDKNPKPFVLD